MTEPFDPEAPYGRKANGEPYKRDPTPFLHLKGKPFGTKSADAKADMPKPPRARRVKDTTPPKGTAAEYASKISKGVDGAGVGLMLRGDAAAKKDNGNAGLARAGLALRISATDMGEAWGPVAVSHPKLGRAIDKLTTQSEVSRAVGTSMMTLAVMARMGGILKDGHPLSKMVDALIVKRLSEWMANNPEEAFAMMGGEGDPSDAGVPVSAVG